MTTMAALFHDSKDLQKALDALHRAGLGDDVVEVVDTPARAASVAVGIEPVPAVLPSEGWEAPTAAPGAWWGRLDDLGDAAPFFRDAVRDGADLLLIETGSPERVAELLREHASRIESAS